jgi:hypothetical protein
MIRQDPECDRFAEACSWPDILLGEGIAPATLAMRKERPA